MEIKILYEDSNILAIDKPAGISVHSDGRSKEKTIADWVLKNYPKMKNVGQAEESQDFYLRGSRLEPAAPEEGRRRKNIETPLRPGIVHRLDRDTSGVLLLAKNQKAYEFLKEQFQNREIKKTYIAIVSGWVREDRGVISKPIGRSPVDFRRYSATRGARGEMREAVTQYKVLKRFNAEAQQNFYPRESHLGPEAPEEGRRGKNSAVLKHVLFTYVEVRPKTGRTHQIRVHMKSIDHPVVCDSLYNPKNPYPKGIKRMALHAKSIEFKDLKGKVIKVESQIPKEFIEVTNCL